eukprot:TRINITY_DN5686_c1_g1_i1.p1 TRINITY_DN5686_c1_g1~~TRINITY_DN5686_c1_g1_i1.p1  ORF type:complete len:348 (+),score=51.75 TRINITY_DN5686_c1_g1_i1:86-1129(+)
MQSNSILLSGLPQFWTRQDMIHLLSQMGPESSHFQDCVQLPGGGAQITFATPAAAASARAVLDGSAIESEHGTIRLNAQFTTVPQRPPSYVAPPLPVQMQAVTAQPEQRFPSYVSQPPPVQMQATTAQGMGPVQLSASYVAQPPPAQMTSVRLPRSSVPPSPLQTQQNLSSTLRPASSFPASAGESPRSKLRSSGYTQQPAGVFSQGVLPPRVASFTSDISQSTRSQALYQVRSSAGTATSWQQIPVITQGLPRQAETRTMVRTLPSDGLQIMKSEKEGVLKAETNGKDKIKEKRSPGMLRSLGSILCGGDLADPDVHKREVECMEVIASRLGLRDRNPELWEEPKF